MPMALVVLALQTKDDETETETETKRTLKLKLYRHPTLPWVLSKLVGKPSSTGGARFLVLVHPFGETGQAEVVLARRLRIKASRPSMCAEALRKGWVVVFKNVCLSENVCRADSNECCGAETEMEKIIRHDLMANMEPVKFRQAAGVRDSACCCGHKISHQAAAWLSCA